MRKFKEVKRKEIIFDMIEWSRVEKQASELSMQTSEYIRCMAVDGKIINLDFKNITPMINSIRSIGNNVNQIARKANEINSIYLDDIHKLQEDYLTLCHILSQLASTIPSIAA